MKAFKYTALGLALLATSFTAYATTNTKAHLDADPLDIEFQLSLDGDTKQVTLADLGVQISEIRSLGRLENSMLANVNFIDSMIKNQTYTFDWETETSEALIRDEWGVPLPKHAEYEVTDEGLVIIPEQDGAYIKVDKVLKRISKDYPRIEETYVVSATKPDLITKDELMGHYPQVEKLTSTGFEIDVNGNTYQFPAQMKDIVVKQEAGIVDLELNKPYLSYIVASLASHTEKAPENIVITGADPTQTSRTESHGRIRDGVLLDREATKDLILNAVQNNESTTAASYTVKKGQVINETGLDLGPLQPLASGISNFEGSAPGRDFNVRKGLNEKVNGILIPPGAEYSFNKHLDGPVTYGNGWKGAYAIFGGNRLETVPGGGICQTSTTIYRAALHAGLEIIRQKPHSMYVSYYGTPSNTTKAGLQGDGLDATIFPGQQDLIFKNNTPNYIYVEAFDEGTDAIVNFYGESDGRETHFEGPFTASKNNPEVIAAVGPLDSTEIAWKQTIKWADGREEVHWLHSDYRTYVPQNQ